MKLSIIIPAYNEAEGLVSTLDILKKVLKDFIYEVIIVDDGSTDNTVEIAEKAGARVIAHPINMGYGRSLKTGIANAKYEIICITDADGTYPLEKIPELLTEFKKGFDMVVGQRTGKEFHGNFLKHPSRRIFRWLCEFAVGKKIPDINSGLRIFNKSTAEKYFDILCDGFSFTTTITLAYMFEGYFVKYLEIPYYKRYGVSKVHYLRDTLRVTQIITEAILYFNPLKIFLVLSGLVLFLSFIFLGIGAYFQYTTAIWLFVLCFISSILIFAMGLQADLLRKIKDK